MSLELISAFLDSLGTAGDAHDLFEDSTRLAIARAPGRLDLMGGIADYSGSLVLQWPLHEGTIAAVAPAEERVLRIASRQGPCCFQMPLADFEWHGKPVSYELAHEYFQRDPDRHWAACAAGVFLVLMRERGVRFHEGASILVDSQLPVGRGLRSSAALAVAVMHAVAMAFDVRLKPSDLALLCQKVESCVAGSHCGITGQMTAALGRAGSLLAVLCQPAQVEGALELPKGMEVWAIDSGARPASFAAADTTVRVGAFMGQKIISESRGGLDYLANLPPSHFEEAHAQSLPERMLGAEFLERYGRTADPLTRVEPDCEYAVRAPAAHPVYENFRARLFEQLLTGQLARRQRHEVSAVLRLLGELMYQSHVSYSACGLGSPGADRLVELVHEAGPENGLYGARITGPGGGGTVAVLARGDSEHAVRAVARQYARETGSEPALLSGSSAGAAQLPHVVRVKKGEQWESL